LIGKLSEDHTIRTAQAASENALVRSRDRVSAPFSFVIGVPVTDALDKSSAQRLLEKYGGRFINYYGSWAVEELKR
jgi:hypothetical protein